MANTQFLAEPKAPLAALQVPLPAHCGPSRVNGLLVH